MSWLIVFIYEWKHFTKSPFKVIAVILFSIAAIYGLNNGKNLYLKQSSEIAKVKQKLNEIVTKNVSYYDQENPIPEDRYWVDLSAPDWAMWYAKGYHFKNPSTAMVYSIGQAEQYGFYSSVNYMSSPYDHNLTMEIANPEHLQTGRIDFSFTLIFLLPLVLIILLYNLKSMENEQGFLTLIEVQTPSKSKWLLTRISFFVSLVYVLVIALLLLGVFITDVSLINQSAFKEMLIYSFLYLLIWTIIYYFILKNGKNIIGNTLKMIGVWLLVTFIIPASVNQWVSIEKSANLMTDFIDTSRDKKKELYSENDSVLLSKLKILFPEIDNSLLLTDSNINKHAFKESMIALVNELKKESVAVIESENDEKNELVNMSCFINPVTFFQNKFNRISKTHYDDYKGYRNDVQLIIDKQLEMMILDMWNDVKVDKKRFKEYQKTFNNE